MKKLILLSLICNLSLYSQEVFLLRSITSQKPFNIQKCDTSLLYNCKDQKMVIRLRYEKQTDELFFCFYEVVHPPYEGRSLFENEMKEVLISSKDLKQEKLTPDKMLICPIFASKMFSTQLSHQQHWNDGVTWSFIDPYKLDGDKIPTLSAKKIR